MAGLNVQPDQWYIDATFGRGGHTREILRQGGQVVAIDYDQNAVLQGQITFIADIQSGRLVLIRENFAKLVEIIGSLPASTSPSIKGVVFDLGTQLGQLTDPVRGLSFTGRGPLDMRLDQTLGVTAADLLAVLPVNELARLFAELGGEAKARAIARAIADYRRQNQPVTRVDQLVEIINRIKYRTGKLHPATQVFQALRMAVNNELENLQQALPSAWRILAEGGRLIVIAFHEGEDRPVKQFMKQMSLENSVRMTKLQKPTSWEVQTNPRARSARLRILEKIKK